MTFEVHQSTLKTWRRCKRQYYYSYVLKIEKRRKSSPLIRGTLVHEMIEEHANGKNPWPVLTRATQEMGKLFTEEREYYGDMIGDIRSIMQGYFRWYEKDPLKPVAIKKGGKKAEHKFEVMLTPSIALAGTIDMVAEDSRQHIWLTDHKTHKQIPNGDLKYSDIQSALYVWVLPQISKLSAYGVAWNYIRWKTPTKPTLLKNGEMSRKAIDTTWTVYREALIEAKLDPTDYEDMREKLDDKESEFFVRQYLPVNQVLLENLVEEARITAREMKRKGGKDRTRTIDKHCTWCDFYNLCQAELRGLDSDFILKHDYQEKKKRHERQDEEE